MFGSKPLEVGDLVTIHGGYSEGPMGQSTIVKIGKMKTTLADGSEWVTRTGRMYGSSSGYGCQHISPARDGDAVKIETKRCIALIERTNARKLPLETLRIIRDAIRAAAKEEQANG